MLGTLAVFGFGGYVTLAVLAAIFFGLLITRFPADLAFMGGVIVLLLTGTISTEAALSGFSAPVVATVGALFFVTAGLENTGVLQAVLIRFFGRPKGMVRALTRLVLNVSMLSAFLSNTLVVSMFAPIVKTWARILGLAPSKLLIPLSYASCMGGMCLLIGTPANLVISQFYAEATGTQLNIFTPFLPGVCVVVAGLLIMLLLGKLLPSRKTAEDALPRLARSYEFKVPRSSHLIGMTLGDADVPTDDGRIRLTGILRFDGEMCANPTADDFLMGGDTLYFTGSRRHAVMVARRCGFDIPEALAPVRSAKVNARMLIALAILLALVAVSAFTRIPLVVCALSAAALMIAFRCCGIVQAKRAVNWDILMIFAGSIVLGKAVDETGIAAIVAQQLLAWCGSNPRLALFLMCLTASIVTEFVSNTACAAVFAPIAIKAATVCAVSPLPFVVGLMVSCSASFMTPIGSPTHLIVFTPGGYRFSDFLRLGILMNLMAVAIATFVVPLVFPLVAG